MTSYSTLYLRFAGLQPDELNSTRLLYPAQKSRPYIKVGKEISDCAVGIPPIRIVKDTITYGPFSFQDNELGHSAATNLAMASASLLSAKSVFRWLYQKYLKEWLSAKSDLLRANYAINVILDKLARQRILEVEGKGFYDKIMKTADLLAASILPYESKDLIMRSQTALMSSILDFPLPAPSSTLNIIQSFVTKLKAFKFDTAGIMDVIRKHVTEENKITEIAKLETKWEELATLGDSLYFIMKKIPGKWHGPYLPYSNILSDDGMTKPNVFLTRIPAEKKFKKLTQSCAGADDPASMFDPALEDLFFDVSKEDKQREKMLRRLTGATEDMEFNNVGYPVGDYVSYNRLHAELGPQIRMMIDRTRQIKNILDENMYQESGQVELQVAIQAIASEKYRDDMFTREDNMQKNESWTILVDASQSLHRSSKQLKAISVCLAETAGQIIGSNTWEMFAFSDELRCIKDYAEPYGSDVKARIGGITQSGLSYIPDAIRASRNLILEHPKDRNYVILISDGLPSGYPGIEEQFPLAIKELGKYGIDFTAIGLGSNSIKKVFRGARVINEPTEIVKEFMELYMNLSM